MSAASAIGRVAVLRRNVAKAVTIEPEGLLRAQAEHSAKQASVPITVLAGHADALPAADDTFDAAVVSFVLCSVPDPDLTLAEFVRVPALRRGVQRL